MGIWSSNAFAQTIVIKSRWGTLGGFSFPQTTDLPTAKTAIDSHLRCSTFVLMEHAPESMRDGAQPYSQTHNLIVEILPQIRPCEMQTIYFQAMEDGPESLLTPIEAEFARRGLSPYATYRTDVF